MEIVLTDRLRAEIKQGYISYYEAYCGRQWDEMVRHIARNFTMFGTAVDEVALNREQALALLRREFDQAPDPIGSTLKKMEVFLLSPGAALIMIALDVTMISRQQQISMDNHRSSILMLKEEGRWKVAHGHWSSPDKDIDVGESVPYRLLIERSKELEDKVVARTRKIEAQRKELDNLNQTKDKLFSVIAHDLRNPFQSILGFSNLLRDNFRDFSPEQVSQMLQALHEQSNAAYDLLENLLGWARSQSGAIAFRPRQLELEPFIAEISSVVRSSAEIKGVSVVFNIDQGVRVFADPPMLQIVLRNLLNNALKYSHPGGEVVVAARQEDGGVCISVRDHGLGMEPEARAKILAGSCCESTPGTAKETGTGLGLMLCRDYLAYHGSRLSIESAQGKGSCFSFLLPANELQTTSGKEASADHCI